MTSDLVLDPALVRLATEAGYRVGAGNGSVLLDGTEVTFVARPDGDGYVLERSSRAHRPEVDVRSTSWTAVELVLCSTLGQAWRVVHGLPPLRPPAGPVPGVELVEAVDLHRVVRWGGGQDATGLRRGRATTLAHTLGFPVGQVAAAWRDPAGRPVFA